MESDAKNPVRSKERTAYLVMAVVILQYVVKVLVKGGFGLYTGSPVFKGDGWHNASDIVQALLVIVGVWLASRPPSREYPLGWRAVDTLGTLAIGVSLGFVALSDVLLPSVSGLFAVLSGSSGPGVGGSELFSGGHGPLAVGIMAASAGVSYLVGRYQVRVGRASGHASVVADGEETLSDMKLEILTAIGLLFQVFVRWQGIEYLLGLAMAAVMFHTSWEILGKGLDMALSRSADLVVGVLVSMTALEHPGVDQVPHNRAYWRGGLLVVELDLETRVGARAYPILEHAVAEDIREKLSAELECEVSVSARCVPPPTVEERRAYLVRRDGESTRLVGWVEEATHLAVCEVTNGVVVSGRFEAVTRATLRALLAEKRVVSLHAYIPQGREDVAHTVLSGHSGVDVVCEPVDHPSLVGLSLA